MEDTIRLDRKAFIIASIVVEFDFQNSSEEYHANQFLAHFNTTGVPVTLIEIKLSLIQNSFQKVLTNYGLTYFTHRTPLDVCVGGPQRGKRIKNSLGGICSKILKYEFPNTSESISCNFTNAERINAIMQKLLLTKIATVPSDAISGTKRPRPFESVFVETAYTGTNSGPPMLARRKGTKTTEDYEN
jgi:hypothetical protein